MRCLLEFDLETETGNEWQGLLGMQASGEQRLEQGTSHKNMGWVWKLRVLCRQERLGALSSPRFPGPTFTYLSFLDLSTHIGRDPQEDLLPAQWYSELANLA